jgi:hypothetical protein
VCFIKTLGKRCERCEEGRVESERERVRGRVSCAKVPHEGSVADVRIERGKPVGTE